MANKQRERQSGCLIEIGAALLITGLAFWNPAVVLTVAGCVLMALGVWVECRKK